MSLKGENHYNPIQIYDSDMNQYRFVPASNSILNHDPISSSMRNPLAEEVNPIIVLPYVVCATRGFHNRNEEYSFSLFDAMHFSREKENMRLIFLHRLDFNFK